MQLRNTCELQPIYGLEAKGKIKFEFDGCLTTGSVRFWLGADWVRVWLGLIFNRYISGSISFDVFDGE